MTKEMYLNRAELLIEIATKAIQNGDFLRYKRAMAFAKACLEAANNSNHCLK